jgi:peptide deformylase
VAVRQVLRFPHPLLKQRAEEVEAAERGRAERVAADLVDTMRANEGCVGLAAPQVGELVRVVVVDVTGHPRAAAANGLLVLVNPRVVASAGEDVAREGCLSIPELTANVRRATEVVVEAVDVAGAPLQMRSVGFEARCVQHELDHLDGVLFLDRVDSLATDVFRRRPRRSYESSAARSEAT